MPHEYFLLVIIGAALVFSVRILVQYVRAPEQLVFLVVGIVLGSTGLISQDNKVMKTMSIIAITLTLFHAGLGEEDISVFFRTVVRNIRVAVISAIGPWLGAFLSTRFIVGLSLNEAIVCGAVFTATALPFTLGILRSKGLMDTAAAKSAIAASTTDDVLASVLGIFTSILLAASMPGAVETGGIGVAWLVCKRVGLVLAFFAILYTISVLIDPHRTRYRMVWVNVPRFTKQFYSSRITFSFIILILSTLVYLGESIFHVHYAIGALLVGILLRRDLFYTRERDISDRHSPSFDNFEATLSPLVHNIEPFFYVYLGLHLNLALISMDAVFAGGVIFLSVASLQFISAYLSGRWIGLGKGDGILLAFCMLPRDVIAFVVLSINMAVLPEDSILLLAAIVAIALLDLLATVGLQLFRKG